MIRMVYMTEAELKACMAIVRVFRGPYPNPDIPINITQDITMALLMATPDVSHQKARLNAEQREREEAVTIARKALSV